MAKIFPDASDVYRTDSECGGDFGGFVEIGGKLMVLREVVERPRRKNCELNSRACDHFDGGTNGSVAAGDEYSLWPFFDLCLDRVFQLVGRDFMNVTRARR